MSETELKEYHLQLESVEAALKADPENAELQSLIDELKELIELTETILSETTGVVRSSSTPTIATVTTPTTPTTPVPGDVPPEASKNYVVGDQVLARWTSGDNSLYPARITSVMGSQKNPSYIVRFTQYNATETLTPKDIKPASNMNKKRKLEQTNGGERTGAPAYNGTIISQPAAVNAELAAQARKKAEEEAGVRPLKKSRKIMEKKVLEQGQKKWQDFAAKGVKGKGGKSKKIGADSMFRTPESVHGRVGFTNSGQPMRRDVARGKHIYQHADDEE